MRRVLLTLLVLTAGCGEQPDPSDPSPSTPASVPTTPPATSPSPSPDDLPDLEGASCKARGGGEPLNTARFVDVDTALAAESEGYERLTFEFEPVPGATGSPTWNVAFVDELTGDGEGTVVDVAGEAFVYISFGAIGTDLSGEVPVAVYKGPREMQIGGEVLLEAELLSDFENVIGWGVGLSREACFRVTAEPGRLAFDFAAAAG